MTQQIINHTPMIPPLTREYRVFPIKDLKAWHNPRSDVAQSNIEELHQALKQNGGYLHLMSTLERNGEIFVFIGGRRLRGAQAALAAGDLTEIETIHYPNISDTLAEQLAGEENLAREDMNSSDLLNYVINQHKNRSVEEIALSTGKGTSLIEQLLYINDNGNDTLTQLLKENKVTPQVAAYICSLNKNAQETACKRLQQNPNSITTTEITNNLNRSGIKLSSALFDPKKYTGKIDGVMGLLGISADPKIASDEESQTMFLDLQEEAAYEIAQKKAEELGYKEGKVVLEKRPGNLKALGYTYSNVNDQEKIVLAKINAQSGEVTFLNGVCALEKENSELNLKETSFQAARQEIQNVLSDILRNGPDAEKRTLAASISQSMMNYKKNDHLPEKINQDYQRLSESQKAKVRSGNAKSNDIVGLFYEHLLTLDIDLLRQAQLELLRNNLQYRSTGPEHTLAQAIAAHEPARFPLPITKEFTQTLDRNNLKTLANSLIIKPQGKNVTREAWEKAILDVAQDNQKEGYELVTHALKPQTFTKTTALEEIGAVAQNNIEVASETTETAEINEAQETLEAAETVSEQTAEINEAQETPEAAETVSEQTAEINEAQETPEAAETVSEQTAEINEAQETPEAAETVSEQTAEINEAQKTPEAAETAETAETIEAINKGCELCGNLGEIWDEETGDMIPCPHLSIKA